ncbi:unnamed protein product, partial [Polarella glacialis]
AVPVPTPASTTTSSVTVVHHAPAEPTPTPQSQEGTGGDAQWEHCPQYHHGRHHRYGRHHHHGHQHQHDAEHAAHHWDPAQHWQHWGQHWGQNWGHSHPAHHEQGNHHGGCQADDKQDGMPGKMISLLSMLRASGAVSAPAVAGFLAQLLPMAVTHVANDVPQAGRCLLGMKSVLQAILKLVGCTKGLEHTEADLLALLSPQTEAGATTEDEAAGVALLQLLTALDVLPLEEQVSFFEVLYGSLEAELGEILGKLASCRQAAPQAAEGDMVHRSITCDGCGMSPLRGLRYKCKTCPDYDLCGECHAKRVAVHGAEHEFECIQKDRNTCWWKNMHQGPGADVAAAVQKAMAMAMGPTFLGKGCKGKGKGKGGKGKWREFWGKGCPGSSENMETTPDPTAPAPDKEQPRACATPGCSFQATWHPTHCCMACAAHGADAHGPKCERQAIKLSEPAGCTEPEPHHWDPAQHWQHWGQHWGHNWGHSHPAHHEQGNHHGGCQADDKQDGMPGKMISLLSMLRASGAVSAPAVAGFLAQLLPMAVTHVANDVPQAGRCLLGMKSVLQAILKLVGYTKGLEHTEADLLALLSPQTEAGATTEDEAAGVALLQLLTALDVLPLEEQVSFFEALYGSLEAELGEILGKLASCRQAAPKAAEGDMVHRSITCDGCGMSPLRGLRYKCKTCPDYDLCGECHTKRVAVHGAEHEFECVQKDRNTCWWKNMHQGPGADVAAAVQKAMAMAMGPTFLGKGCKGKGKGKGGKGKWREFWGKGCPGSSENMETTPDPTAPAPNKEQPRACATPGCSFQATWHPTHCCKACAAHGADAHGPKCERQAIKLPEPAGSTEPEAFEVPEAAPQKSQEPAGEVRRMVFPVALGNGKDL